jgi:hypothetical protein
MPQVPRAGFPRTEEIMIVGIAMAAPLARGIALSS